MTNLLVGNDTQQTLSNISFSLCHLWIHLTNTSPIFTTSGGHTKAAAAEPKHLQDIKAKNMLKDI